MSLNSRRKLKPADAQRFANADSALFVELAKVVCATGMLPQKELHECWQMANAVHKAFPESLRVADIAAGHGLLAWILVLLARTSAISVPRTAVAFDISRPKSADILAAAITHRWPNLADSVHFVEGSIDAVIAGDGPGTLLVAAHACGSLSDRVLMAAIASGSSVAIMPCCHSLRNQGSSLSSLALAAGFPADSIDRISASAGVVGQAASIDQFRMDMLAAFGYELSEAAIQREISAFNRIIMGRRVDVTSPIRFTPSPRVVVKHFGEIRAFEKVHTLNVANIEEAQALSRRPSREWLRFFDLSYWVENEATGQSIADVFNAKVKVETDLASSISLRDRYTDPTTQRLAFTYRIEVRSSTVAITKNDAIFLRRTLCRALEDHSQMLPGSFALRGNVEL
ncbi:MAG: methyltransferase [Proteobacteria bacterium]|nr:methyltransferase [Pseudomonadota bacterium]